VTAGNPNGRTIRKQVLAALEAPDREETMARWRRFPERRLVNALFYFLLHPDETIRWRAISVMAATVDGLARVDMEAARVVMRRLMWNLNKESGGIGWGAPEVMAEVMARNEALADEYAIIYISYLDERFNLLEFEPLQRGLLWGLVRLLRESVRSCLSRLDRFSRGF